MEFVLKRFTVLAGLFVLPGLAWGLAFGEIQNNSYLNQNLDAEIMLHTLNPAEVIDARVILASRAAHDRAGLKMRPILNKLHFNIVRKENGEFVVKVVTRAPVKEPTVEFVLELNGAAGRFQRAFSIHMDPPPL
jgi:pilus assembly protein FimV